MKIYTKTGDSGDTGLFGGPRVRKDAVRIEAYGTVDELNAVLGVVRSEAVPNEIDPTLERIQNQLFDVGAELATPDPSTHTLATIGKDQIGWLEEVIDRNEAQLEPLSEFILPGGTRAAAYLHLARCTCRRAERLVVRLAAEESISPCLITYLNRLSDLLFVLARFANHLDGEPDVAWEKGS